VCFSKYPYLGVHRCLLSRQHLVPKDSSFNIEEIEVMASATRLPVRSITAVISGALVLSAYKSQPLMVKFVTGPGNWSRILALAVVLANAKILPGVWHVSYCLPPSKLLFTIVIWKLWLTIPRSESGELSSVI
jgi:hypothetical protein